MKPFRKNVGIAIDGGGVRGVIATRALTMLEEALQQPVHDTFRLLAGTSTGSIVSAGIGAGLTARKMNQLYIELSGRIFKKSWRTFFWPLTRYRYPPEPLRKTLQDNLGDIKIGDFWKAKPRTDVIITTFDVLENRTRFIKPWKSEYTDWPVVTAVLASCVIPAYFPVVEGRYVDGGVGSFGNPTYIAAYEATFLLRWKPEETTLLSLGTGREPNAIQPGEPDRFHAWDWLVPILDAILISASDQQVNLVETFFEKLDFRRFQVDLAEPIAADDPSKIDELLKYGEQMGNMILNDQMDHGMAIESAPVSGIIE